MKTSVISERSSYLLEKKLNEEIENILDREYLILDIKLSNSEDRYTAMVIYCTKQFSREHKINNLLDK